MNHSASAAAAASSPGPQTTPYSHRSPRPGRQEHAARIRMVDVVDPVAVLAERAARSERRTPRSPPRRAPSSPWAGMPSSVRTRLWAPSAAIRYRARTWRSRPVATSRSVARTPSLTGWTRGDLDAELDPRAVRAGVGEQHRLEVVLGDARRRGGADHAALLARRQPDRDGTSRRPASASVSHGQHQPLRRRRRRPAPRPRAPHDRRISIDRVLHRGRARQRRERGAALDDEAVHPEPGQRAGRGQAGRPAARRRGRSLRYVSRSCIEISLGSISSDSMSSIGHPVK